MEFDIDKVINEAPPNADTYDDSTETYYCKDSKGFVCFWSKRDKIWVGSMIHKDECPGYLMSKIINQHKSPLL